jgi:thioredoxin 1
VDVTDANFEGEVLQGEVPVLVDFWAPWCGPCRAIEPILEQLASEHARRLRVVRVNVDENYVTASRYGVLSLPTIILFQGGEPRETLVGAYPRSRYERALGPWVAGA